MSETLEEIIISRFSKEQSVKHIESSSENFDEAIKLSLLDDERIGWRAAWIIFHAMKKNDPRLKKYTGKIVKSLKGKRDGHQRELLKILDKMELGEDDTGRLFDACLTIWESIEKSPSVRIFAFKSLVKIIKQYPELKDEITHLTQNHYTESLSPGIKNSFKKIQNDLNKIKPAF